VPAPVNYVGKGANLYSLGYRYHGSVHVISNLLRTSYLWERVRVQGGAYGAFCSFDRLAGGFIFVSYRDPNLLGTLDVYDRAAEFLRSPAITQDELVKSIIGAIGDLDTYLLPDARGMVSMQRFLNGVTDESRQSMRQEILGTTTADVAAFADALEEVARHGLAAVLGSPQAIKQANEERGLFPAVIPLM
jgi:Zn-dependent M16 (insulinase) family peptidase